MRPTPLIASCLLGLCALAAPNARAQDGPESIGSTRNARIAYPMPAGQRPVLTFLAGNLPDVELAELQTLAPNIRFVRNLTPEEALARAPEFHGAEARFATPEFLEKATSLVWVQAMSAGVDRYVPLLADNDRIVLTNMRAVHAPAIADHAFAMLLSLTRNLRFHAQSQAEASWSRGDEAPRSTALHGKTMLVVGIGGIGAEIAQRAHGFGMRVIAIRRSDAPAPDFVERVGKPADLHAMLPDADVVAICVPLTAETDGLFDTASFAAMKPGAYLINIARGRIVRTPALLAALDSGRLAGACLDVTDPEPLPADHPLWKRTNVIITPHTAADAEQTDERRWTLFRENIRRFGAGEPLLNCVDRQAGY